MTEDGTRSVSVIFLPRDIQNELENLAAEWTASWMIRSSIWVAVDDCVDEPGGGSPPRIAATVVGRNGTAKVDLFEELSRHEYGLVRFVAMRTVRANESVDRDQDSRIDQVAEYLRYSKPSGTTIRMYNVILAPSNLDEGSLDHLIERGWNRNIVVSPEDRRTGNSFDAFTRHSSEERWVGFSLANICSVAALWVNLPVGPYDDMEFDGFMEATHAQRIVVRGVLTGALVVDIAMEAMKIVSRDDSPLQDPLIAGGEDDLRLLNPEQESETISALITASLSLSDGQLAFNEPVDQAPPVKGKMRYFEQLRDFMAFSWDKVTDAPRWLFRKISRREADRLEDILQGDGTHQVDAAGIRAWEDAQQALAIDRINERRETILSELDAPSAVRRYDIDGLLFTELRQACFAWLDGDISRQRRLTPLVVGGDTPGVVSSVSSLIPDWSHSWQPPEAVAHEFLATPPQKDSQKGWLDLAEIREWKEVLNRRRTRLQARENELRQRLGIALHRRSELLEAIRDMTFRKEELEDELDWLLITLPDDEDGETLAEEPLAEIRQEIQQKIQELEQVGSELNRAQRENSMLDSRIARVREHLDLTESSLAQVNEAHKDLEDWVAARRNSFAWRLLDRLDQEHGEAKKHLNEIRGELSEPIQAPAITPSLLQDRFMKTSYFGLSVVLAIMSALLILQRVLPEEIIEFAAPLSPLSWPWWVLALVGALVVILIVIKALATYYKSNSERQWDIRVKQSELDNRESKAHALKRELQRLQSLHDQVPGYFQFLSEVLHRPWSEPAIVRGDSGQGGAANSDGSDEIGLTPEELVFGSKRPSYRAFPSLLRIAEPVSGSGGAQEQVLIRETVQDILRPGWRFDFLIRLVEAVEYTHQLTPGTFAVERMDRDPRLREAFLEYLSTDGARTEAGLRYLRTLSLRIQSKVMDEVHPPVSDLSPDPTGHLELDEDALPGTKRGVKEWDAFLAEALGEGTAWSPLLFGHHALRDFKDARHDVSILAFGPSRLDGVCAESLSYFPQQDDTIRPIDLVVRIEFTTEALGPQAFKVFERAEVSSDSPEKHQSGVESDGEVPPSSNDDIML